MKRNTLQITCLILLLSWLPSSVFAITLNEAARNVARQHDAKVLSARTIQQGDKRIHEIKVLTKKGVVKTVRVPDNSKRR
ncbi:MAG: hypothetical protein OQJ84_11240 [Xanthomonadales bacterium]|nr:hypothetical protein [Xanthomonadales bacterium]